VRAARLDERASMRGAAMIKVLTTIFLVSVWLVPPANAEAAGQATSIRADLDTILWQDQSIDAVMGKAAAEALVDARQKLAGMSDEQLELLAPHAASIAALRDKTSLLARTVLSVAETAKAARQARSAGFPDAEYYTDSMCTAVRNDTTAMKVAWNTLWAAETVLDAMEYVCLEDIVGFNGALACVGLAVAVGVASQVVENFEFCDDDVDSAEIGGSYQRLGHLHGDLTVVQETLDQGTIEYIEVDLARRRYYIGEYMIPESSNGKLEQVRDVVTSVVTRMIAAGIDVRFAELHLQAANGYYAAGDWKRCYKELGFAYRDAVLVH
jgi:hypothetical protein